MNISDKVGSAPEASQAAGVFRSKRSWEQGKGLRPMTLFYIVAVACLITGCSPSRPSDSAATDSSRPQSGDGNDGLRSVAAKAPKEAELKIGLAPAKTNFVNGEPVIARLRFDNLRTDYIDVDLGRHWSEHIFFWTEQEQTKIRSVLFAHHSERKRHYLYSGPMPKAVPFTMLPEGGFEMLVVLDDWLWLKPGRTTVQMAIERGDKQLTASAVFSVSEADDQTLDAVLRQFVLWMAATSRKRPTGWDWEVNWRSLEALVMRAVEMPRVRAAFLRLQEEFPARRRLNLGQSAETDEPGSIIQDVLGRSE